MRSSSYGVAVIMLCFLLMQNLILQQFTVLALNEKCFNDCINNSLCEAPRVQLCVERCRRQCGGALNKLSLDHSSPKSCKLHCSVSICSKFSSDAKEHLACSQKCSKKYCKFD